VTGCMFRGLSNERRQMAWNSTSDCSRSRSLGLARNQRRLCQNHLDMMPSVVSASRDTVDICQELFADRRWNCSTILLAPNFLPDLAGSKFAPAAFHSQLYDSIVLLLSHRSTSAAWIVNAPTVHSIKCMLNNSVCSGLSMYSRV